VTISCTLTRWRMFSLPIALPSTNGIDNYIHVRTWRNPQLRLLRKWPHHAYPLWWKINILRKWILYSWFRASWYYIMSPNKAALEEGPSTVTWYDLYRRLKLQFYVLLMMGAMDTRNMQSKFAVNKYLHTVAFCWILLILIYSQND